MEADSIGLAIPSLQHGPARAGHTSAQECAGILTTPEILTHPTAAPVHGGQFRMSITHRRHPMSDPIRTFRHFRDVPDRLWRWKNFSPAEIACRGTGQLKLHPEALDKLQALRDRLGKPLIVRSAYRSPQHNRNVGGAPRSKHMDGTAFDIAMANHDPVAFEAAAREVGFLGFGTYPRSGFMHIDLGPARNWGEPFPARAAGFVPETRPAREAIAQSRTLQGTGAAGVATVGAAGVEVAQEVLTEAQGAVLPLVPYLDTLRWLFIALALAGIAVAVWARLDDWKKGLR